MTQIAEKTYSILKGDRIQVWEGLACYCMIQGQKHYKHDLTRNAKGTIVSLKLQEKQKTNYKTNISIQQAFRQQAYRNRADSLLRKAKKMEKKSIVKQVNKMLGIPKEYINKD